MDPLDPTGIIAPPEPSPFDQAVADLLSEMGANPRAKVQSAARAYAPQATGDMPSGATFVPNMPRPTGEARTNTTSLGDLVPYSLAPAVSAAQRGLNTIADIGGEGNQLLRDTAYMFTGIPSAMRGGENLAKATESGDLPRAAASLAQVGFSALPISRPVGKLLPDIINYGTRFAGVPIAAGISMNPTANAADTPTAGGGDVLNRLLVQQAELQRQAEAARQRRESFRPQGRAPRPDKDPQYTQADEEFRSLDSRLKALDPQIAQETRKNDPAYQEQLRQEREANLKAEQERRAATPTRELMSDYMPYLYPATTTLAMVMGGSLAARSLSNRNQLLQGISDRWSEALNRANAAGGTTVARRQGMLEAQGLNQLYDDAVRAGASPFKDAFKMGAKVGVTGAFLPEEIDFGRAAIGSPLWGKLKEGIIDDPLTTLKRALMGGGFGGAAGMIGAAPAVVFGNKPAAPNYGPETRALTAVTPEPRIPSRAAARQRTSQEPTALRPAESQAQGAQSPALPQDPAPKALPAPRSSRSSAARGSNRSASQSLPEGHTIDAKGNHHGPNGRFANKPRPSDSPRSVQIDDTKPYGRE